MVDCICNDGSPCNVCEAGSDPQAPCAQCEGCSAGIVTRLRLGSNTIANLFDLGIPECQCGKSVQEMLDQNLPIVIIYVLAIATRDQETLETFINSIQMQQKQQEADIANSITMRTAAQIQKEYLAYHEEMWEALAGISPSGSQSKEKYEPSIWQLIVGIILLTTLLGLILMVVLSLVSEIAKLAIKSHAQMREFNKVMSWLNPSIAIADGAVAATCEINGIDPSSAEMQKLRMNIILAISIIAAIILIIIAIAAAPFTGGSSLALAAVAIAGMIAAAIQITCAVIDYLQAERELKLAEKRFVLNKLLAAIEQLKMNLETIDQEIDLLIEMFASKMSEIRSEYEKASRILKEYNDAKRMIAQNIKS
jgi:hypothetical protein